MSINDPLRPCLPESRTRSYKQRTKTASSPEKNRPDWKQQDYTYVPDYGAKYAPGNNNAFPQKFSGLNRVDEYGNPVNTSGSAGSGQNPFSNYGQAGASPGAMGGYNPPPQATGSPHDCNCHGPAHMNDPYQNPVTTSAAMVSATAAATGRNWPSGLSMDIPPTAGTGKYSRQSVAMMAADNPMVQAALAAGQKVVLVRDNTVGGRRVAASQVLGNAGAGGNPLYVSFMGDLNADGSQANGGRQAAFTFPDGSTAMPGMSDGDTDAHAQPKKDCGCHGSHADDEDEDSTAITTPCTATASRKHVTDSTHSTGTVRKESCPEPDEEL